MATEEQIARKRRAGLGKREEPGTVYGSKWTLEERAELKALLDEHGRNEAAKLFSEAHSHRTVASALYQIDRNLTKDANASRGPASLPPEDVGPEAATPPANRRAPGRKAAAKRNPDTSQ